MPEEEHLSTKYQNFVRGEPLPPLKYEDRVKPIVHSLHFDFFESLINAASPDWDYKNGGADWNFTNCNMTAKKV